MNVDPRFHSAVFEELPFAAIVHDRERIVACNALAREVLGYDDDQLVGLPFDALTHSDATEAGSARRDAVFAHSTFLSDVPVKLIDRSGKPVHLNVHARHFVVGQEDYIVVVVSEPGHERLRPAIASKLPEFGAEMPVLGAALAAVPIPVVIGDRERVVFATQAAALLLGATTGSALNGVALAGLAHPKEREFLRQRARLMDDPDIGTLDFSTTMLRFDGVALDVHARSHIVQTVGGPHSILWILSVRAETGLQA